MQASGWRALPSAEQACLGAGGFLARLSHGFLASPFSPFWDGLFSVLLFVCFYLFVYLFIYASVGLLIIYDSFGFYFSFLLLLVAFFSVPFYCCFSCLLCLKSYFIFMIIVIFFGVDLLFL